MKIKDVKKKVFQLPDYTFKVAIDGMAVPSVLSILNISGSGTGGAITIGVDFFLKDLRLFDPRKNKNVKVKVQVWVMAQTGENFKMIRPMYYSGTRIAFFIKENNVRSVENFQATVKGRNIPIIKILDTQKEFTYELFESTIKEYIESYEE